MLNKRTVAATLKNSRLNDFFQVAHKEASTEVKKRQVKSATKSVKQLYEFPKSFHNTNEHGKEAFKDGKVNIWHWNVNGVNAVLTK